MFKNVLDIAWDICWKHKLAIIICNILDSTEPLGFQLS